MKLRIDEVYDYNRNWTHEYTSAIWNLVKSQENLSILWDTRAQSRNNVVLYNHSKPNHMFEHRSAMYKFWQMLVWQTVSVTLAAQKDYIDTFGKTSLVPMHGESTRHIRPDEMFFQLMHSFDEDFESGYLFLQSYMDTLYVKFKETNFSPFLKNPNKFDVTVLLHEINFDTKKLPSGYCRPETFISTFRIYEHTKPQDHWTTEFTSDKAIVCFCNKEYYTITDEKNECIFCGMPVRVDSFEKYIKQRFFDIQSKHRLENGVARRGSIAPKIRMSVLNRDGLHCQTCGISLQAGEVVMAHIVSVSYAEKIGMKDSICNGADNLIVSCRTCNAAQGKKPMSYKWYDHWTTANKIKKHEKIMQALKSYDPSRTPEHA